MPQRTIEDKAAYLAENDRIVETILRVLAACHGYRHDTESMIGTQNHGRDVCEYEQRPFFSGSDAGYT